MVMQKTALNQWRNAGLLNNEKPVLLQRARVKLIFFFILWQLFIQQRFKHSKIDPKWLPGLKLRYANRGREFSQYPKFVEDIFLTVWEPLGGGVG
jgi:hypothetical protein